MILKLLTIITLLIGVSSISLKEDISKEEISYYLENNLSELNKELKREGYDIILYEAKSYNIKVYTYEECIDSIITLYNYGEFYFNYTDNLVLFDYGTNFNDEYKTYLYDNKLIYKTLESKYYYIENDELKSFEKYDEEAIRNATYCASGPEEGFANNGTLQNTELYMKARYSKDAKLKEKKSIRYKKQMFYNIPVTIERYEYMQGFDMSKLSCYADSNNASDEGSCVLISAYTIANYWMKSRHEDINTDTKDIYNPENEEPNMRINYLNRGDHVVDENRRIWPELYRRMRHICYERYGKIENLTNWDSSTIIERTLKTYDVNVDSIEGFADMYAFTIITEVGNNNPVLLGVLNNSVYGNHLMVICGYELWSYKEKFLFFSLPKELLLAEVKDGWTEESRYFNFITHYGLMTLCVMREG